MKFDNPVIPFYVSFLGCSVRFSRVERFHFGFEFVKVDTCPIEPESEPPDDIHPNYSSSTMQDDSGGRTLNTPRI